MTLFRGALVSWSNSKRDLFQSRSPSNPGAPEGGIYVWEAKGVPWVSSGRGRGTFLDGERIEGDTEARRGGWNGPGGSKKPVAEVASVKDNFRLGGRSEESQREVKELDIVFRRAGESTTESRVGSLLLGTGTAGDVVVCSNDVLKSKSDGLNEYRCRT